MCFWLAYVYCFADSSFALTIVRCHTSHPCAGFYWGTVSHKQQKRGREFVYKIDFYDGDGTKKDLSSQFFHRMEEVVKLYQQPTKIPLHSYNKPPAAYQELWNTAFDGPPPLDAFDICTTPPSTTAKRQRLTATRGRIQK